MHLKLQLTHLISNNFQDFQRVAFDAMSPKSLMSGIHKFLDDSLVLPPGDWEQETLLPIIGMAKKKANEVRRKSQHRLAMKSKHMYLSTSSSHEKQAYVPFYIR